MSEAAAPKITIIAQMIKPSESADDIRSSVTAPPIRTPGIHEGSGMRGSEKIVVPGIGTPIVTAIKVRINKIHAANFNVQVKLLPHGASSRKR